MAYNYRWPLRQVETITSFYGDASPENIAKGYAANHIGIDIAADIGTAVYPCADGYIESYGNTTERGNYVNILLIDGEYDGHTAFTLPQPREYRIECRLSGHI